MTSDERAHAATRPDRRIAATGLVVVVAAIAVACGHPLLAASSSVLAPPIASLPLPTPTDVPRTAQRGAVDEADGVVPDGTTVFDDIPGVANLDPALRGALRRAATDAAGDGVDVLVNSGWRSPAYQERLLRAAVSKYGTAAKAARWVGTPKTSAHVSGDAVDVGPSAATAWLSEHGATYGLCQIYRNEPWHYELRPRAIDHGCPAMYADAAHDPRMQR
jgi:zinc D-Ala-D-Ala carboxypeptidase